MTTVIFVHGTGGRKPAYAITFGDIEKKLSQLNPEIKLVPCLWGEPHGTKLNANGASIPEYDSTGGTAKSNNQEVSSVQLWEQLYKNPLSEILLLSFRLTRGQAAVPGKLTPSQKLRNKVNQLTAASSTLPTQLQQAGIAADVFAQAHQAVTQSNPYNRLLDTASASLDEDYAAIARAIVAQAIELCERKFIDTPIRFDSDLRDKTVDLINRELTNETSRGIIGDIGKNMGLLLGKYVVNRHLQRQRGSLTDAAYPFSGDILYYQTKGQKIREFIRSSVENVKPPVVLLAHSLGGIACVDLLVAQKLPWVKLLVTVGSQAPFLYEIDALQSLAYGESLPEYFPKWLNIYDLRDILSYVGNRQGLFPGRIKDVKVDNQQPFPESHGAYWSNPATWDAILKELELL
ncbi:MAG: hypothetical protein H0X31_08575 [Nostocaceae cyanobacterium]|nr:hypothetical protein [Nostocaceae cyanobacterium]